MPAYSMTVFVNDAGAKTEIINANPMNANFNHVLAAMPPIGSIIPFYDFAAALTFNSSYWAYCDGSGATIAGIGVQTLPDLSNRYLVGFGTEGGGDIDTAVWATAAVGQASHTSASIAHSHTVNNHTHAGTSDGTDLSHTHTGPSHIHGVGSLQFISGYFKLGYFGAYLSNGVAQDILFEAATSYNNGADHVASYWQIGSAANTEFYTKSGTGSTAAGGTEATGSSLGSHTHTFTTGGTAPGTDSQLTTISVQPRSIRVRFLLRIL